VNDDDFAELFKQLSSGPSTEATWQDVASEFEALGRTFSEVLRRMWQSADTVSGMGRLQDMLADAIGDLNQAVDGTPEAVEARQQLMELRDNLRSAVERATADLRPELLRLLREANAELRRQAGLDSID
jgi:hypothetical protein